MLLAALGGSADAMQDAGGILSLQSLPPACLCISALLAGYGCTPVDLPSFLQVHWGFVLVPVPGEVDAPEEGRMDPIAPKLNLGDWVLQNTVY